MENVGLEFDRIDLRNIRTVTIDGADSKDFKRYKNCNNRRR